MTTSTRNNIDSPPAHNDNIFYWTSPLLLIDMENGPEKD